MTLVVEGLFKSYGAIPVLHEIALTVAEGDTLAIIGPNGAGKTTLFKCVTGEILPDRGTVRYRDEDITRLPAYERVKRGLGRTFQVARIFPNYSVEENIVVAVEARRRHKGEGRRRLIDIRPAPEALSEAALIAGRVNLEAKLNVQGRFLSHGDKKRLEIGVMLALRPRIMMMDEPTAGMSPTDRHQTVGLIARVKQETGATIMLTEHDMDVVFGLSDRIMVLNYGRIIAVGAAAEVRANPSVREVYLGEELADA